MSVEQVNVSMTVALYLLKGHRIGCVLLSSLLFREPFPSLRVFASRHFQCFAAHVARAGDSQGGRPWKMLGLSEYGVEVRPIEKCYADLLSGVYVVNWTGKTV